MLQRGENDCLIRVGRTFSAVYAGTEALEHNGSSGIVPRKITDAVSARTDAGEDTVIFSSAKQRHGALAPHSGQNRALAGSGFPQFVQKGVVSIFAPQDRQNLEPAGTAEPQAGHTPPGRA